MFKSVARLFKTSRRLLCINVIIWKNILLELTRHPVGLCLPGRRCTPSDEPWCPCTCPRTRASRTRHSCTNRSPSYENSNNNNCCKILYTWYMRVTTTVVKFCIHYICEYHVLMLKCMEIQLLYMYILTETMLLRKRALTATKAMIILARLRSMHGM